jgi:hypothetical protein
MSMQALSDAFWPELSAAVFGQHIQLVLITVIFFFSFWRHLQSLQQ